MNSWIVRKKDELGNKYDIRINFRNDKLYIEDVGVIAKGKRKPIYIGSSMTDDYGWRALAWEGRRKAIENEILKVVPEGLMLEAVKKVWKELEPNELNFWS